LLKSLWNSMTGLSAQIQAIDVTANNIANISTPGFKRQSVGFSELVRQRMVDQGLPVTRENADRVTQGSGTMVSSTRRQFAPGTHVYTGRNLDLAIAGRGFFQLTGENGETFYTRDGGFTIDNDGRITNTRGLALLDGELPQNYSDLMIDEAGRVSCRDENGDRVEIGQIELAVFDNPNGLTAAGDNLFTAAPNTEPESMVPGEEGVGSIKQGYLENSNVDIVMEIQLLIEAQRSFQLNAKSMTTVDQLWNITNNLQK